MLKISLLTADVDTGPWTLVDKTKLDLAQAAGNEPLTDVIIHFEKSGAELQVGVVSRD